MTLIPEQIAKVKQYIAVYDESMLENPNLDFVIQDNADSLSESCFGSQYEKAIAFLTMHILAIASQTSGSGEGGGSGATGGAVIQRTIGPITIKWASPKDSSSSKYWEVYKTTKFGLMFLDLLKVSTLGCGISVNEAWRYL